MYNAKNLYFHQIGKRDSAAIPPSDCGAHVRHDVAPEHVLRHDERLVLDDDVLDAPDELGVGGEAADVLRLGVATDPERVVGVGGANPGDADAGLGEDLVHGEGDHVLGLHGCKRRAMVL